jgi:flagellar biosynthetic protein FliQ
LTLRSPVQNWDVLAAAGGREAIVVAMMVGAPVLLVGVVVGLVVGLLQALTQVQDQTISFVPKLVAMAVALGFCLPWRIEVMTDYSESLFSNIPRLISGG